MGAKSVSCSKTKPFANSPQRDSFPAHHQPAAPHGNGSKDRGRIRAPDAQHPPDTAVVTSNSTRKFPGWFIDLLIHLPKLRYIKYVTPEIKYTHYCNDSRFWDNLKHNNLKNIRNEIFFVLYFYSTMCRAEGYYSEKREKDYYFLWCKGTSVVNLLPLTSFLPSTLLFCIIHSNWGGMS